MLQPWSGHQGAVAVFCFSVFKMHVLSSLQSQHPLGSSSDLSHFRYTLSSTKLPPLPSSPEKNQTSQNSNLKLKMESGVDKRMLSHCELIAFFFLSWSTPGSAGPPSSPSWDVSFSSLPGVEGMVSLQVSDGCRTMPCPCPPHPIPCILPALSPQLLFALLLLPAACCLGSSNRGRGGSKSRQNSLPTAFQPGYANICSS